MEHLPGSGHAGSWTPRQQTGSQLENFLLSKKGKRRLRGQTGAAQSAAGRRQGWLSSLPSAPGRPEPQAPRHTGPRAPRRWSFCTCCSLSTVGPTPPPVSPAYLSLSLNPKHPPSSGSPPPLRPQNEVSSSLQGPGWREHPLLPPSLTKWLLLKHPRHAPASGLLCLLFPLSECSFLPWPLGFLLPSLLGSGKVPSSGEPS